MARKRSSKVPVPRANPLGKHRQPAGFVRASAQSNGIRPTSTRIYTKDAARQDPTAFMDFGFGTTGRTGES